MIASIVVAGTILICIGPMLLPPKYTAKSQILIEPQGLMASQGSVVELPADEAAMQTEIASLTSPDFLQRILDSMPADPAFMAARDKPFTATDSVTDDLWHRLTAWAPLPWFTATGEPGPLSIRQLLRHLHVAQETGSHVVGVSVTSISPDEAAAVANRLTRSYVESQQQQKRASTERTLSWIATRVPELRDDVKRLDAAVQTYRTSNNIGGNNPKSVNDDQLNDLNRQLGIAETDLATITARRDGVRESLKRGGGPMTIAGYLQSPMLSKLYERELALREKVASAENSFITGSPLMNKAKAELAEVRRQMNQEADRGVNDLAQEVGIATVRVQTIKQRLLFIRGASTDVSLSELERDATSSHRLLDNLLSRQEQLREQRESLSPGVRVLSLAQPPLHPSSINPILFVPPAAILSFIFASFLAIARAHLDRTFRSEGEVSDALGIPCIGLVPEIRNLRRIKPHQYLLKERFSPYAEAIRSVAAGLQLSSAKQASKVLLVTSSVPAEGKTTLAVSTAVYLATLGRRVVILDLDFRRPAVARELGGKANGNLLDLINRDRPLPASVQHVPGLPLDFLVAPRGLAAEPLSLFASDEMARLLQQLRDDYDHVIIDSAPLLAVTETRLLVAMADTVLFVVEWGKTRREVAKNALRLLPRGLLDGESGRNRVCAVVARVDLAKHARYSYGDSAECIIEYGSYFANSSKGMPMIALSKPANGPGKLLSRRERHEG
jgi:succinoglycan biosynthesis transport protein ExoP